jgi:hypothetical protein
LPFANLWDRLVSLTPSLLPHFSPSLLLTAPRRPVPRTRDGMAGDELAHTSRPVRATQFKGFR